jgi:hypothetical protein
MPASSVLGSSTSASQGSALCSDSCLRMRSGGPRYSPPAPGTAQSELRHALQPRIQHDLKMRPPSTGVARPNDSNLVKHRSSRRAVAARSPRRIHRSSCRGQDPGRALAAEGPIRTNRSLSFPHVKAAYTIETALAKINTELAVLAETLALNTRSAVSRMPRGALRQVPPWPEERTRSACFSAGAKQKTPVQAQVPSVGTTPSISSWATPR